MTTARTATRPKKTKKRAQALARRPAPGRTDVPKELASLLKKNSRARAAWEGMPPSHQRQYARWVAEAKKAETRERRAAGAIAMIASYDARAESSARREPKKSGKSHARARSSR